MRNQETKTPLASSTCPVLDLLFSQLFQVRWAKHGSILPASAARSPWIFYNQIQISPVRWSLFVPVPGMCPFSLTWGTCRTCERVGQTQPATPSSTSQRLQESSWAEGRREQGGTLWWEYQSCLYFPIFGLHERTTEKKGFWVRES